MKKAIEKPSIFWPLSVFLYCVCVVLVGFVVCFFPVSQQRPRLIDMAQRVGEAYIENGDYYKPYEFDYVYILDINGNLIYETESEFPWVKLVPMTDLSAMAQSCQNGANPFRWYFDFEYNDLLLITGARIMSGDQSVGSAFAMRNIKNLPEAVEGALLALSILYWTFVILFSFEIRRRARHRVLEENYVANVTHALKAPIASVRAVTEALIDVVPAESDQQQPYFGEILRETAIQSHIVQEILDLSKIQSGRVDFSKKKLIASEVFNETFEKYSTYCELAGIPFSISDSFNKISPLYSNATCINEIMNILLENAVKYVEEGEIKVVLYKKGKSAIIQITNTEGVIDSADLPHVFERFFTGKNKELKDGTGLGLSIAKALTDGLKEKIWVESSPENGTTFSFSVRLK